MSDPLSKRQLQKLRGKAESVAMNVSEGTTRGAFGESYEQGLVDGLAMALGEVNPDEILDGGD